MAKVAREEGFSQIAEQMEGVAGIERHHEERYLRLREDIRQKRVFDREEEHIWVCTNCGHHHKGNSAPELCPVCFHDRGYFKIEEKVFRRQQVCEING